MSRELDDLIPVPREVTPLEGTCAIEGREWTADRASLAHTATEWKLTRDLDLQPQARTGQKTHAVTAGNPPENAGEVPEHEQGYLLRVGPEGLLVRGHDADGLYWGLVTLEQLLGGGPHLPCCLIRDWPAFRLRGHHDDISRKQVSRISDFRRIIRLLSRYKSNVYTPYMEDMLYLKSYPDVGQDRGRLTPAEVAAMHLEAERYNVTIMPTYSLIGHQENLLSDPKYAHLGREVFQPMSSLDPAKPEVREFLRNVIADVCELFPGPYFHGGFDETQGVEAEEFLEHANWCARQLARHGKRMPMWVDMIYNHFGYDMINKLEDNIIPVNWQYGCREGEVPHQRELVEQGRPVWGLASYSNTARFLPNFDKGKANIDTWAEVGVQTRTPALFSSQWGDHGYENHRDMCWNMFAYLGEAGWSGPDARPADFERRFQLSFYRAELPALTEIIEELPGRLSMEMGDYWRHFRRNAYGMARWAVQNPNADAALERDEQLLRAGLESVADMEVTVRDQKEHLDHFRVALMRMLSVTQRLRLALRWQSGLHPREAGELCERTRKELKSVRDAYLGDWLRTNKWQNVKVSLGVYDDLLLSYELLPGAGPPEEPERDGFLMLDLSEHFNRNFLPVGGLPVGERTYNGVPFFFASERHTHLELGDDGSTVELSFSASDIVDLHLVISAHKVGDEPRPAAALELLNGGEVTFSEELLNIRHLCDWWAPRGEHIWAGGGMAYVDRDRVQYALKPGHMYGLAHLSGFELGGVVRGDALRLRALEGQEIRLFAATLELAE